MNKVDKAIRMRLQFILYALVLFITVSCDNENTHGNNTTGSLVNATHFPTFNQFPTQQFKTLELGLSNSEMKRRLQSMALTSTAQHEVSYFTLKEDSSEIIIPNSAVVNEFKIYLKGSAYLNKRDEFYTFLEAASDSLVYDDDFTVFYYTTPEITFKLTYFEAENTIRLHFVRIIIPS